MNNTKKIHPLCERFPKLVGPQLKPLIDDISENGLRNPIVIYEDMILDGQNRLAACEAAGVEPKFRIFEGTRHEAMKFVVSENMARRHMNTTQRAIWAAEFAEWLKLNPEYLEEIQKTSTAVPNNHKKAGNFTRSNPKRPPNAVEVAADTADVSESSVKQAASFLKKGSKSLVAAANSGEVTVSVAAAVSKLPKQEQSKLIAKGPAAIRQEARRSFDMRNCYLSDKPEEKPTWRTPAKPNGAISPLCEQLAAVEQAVKQGVRDQQTIEYFVLKIEACYEQNKARWNQIPPATPRSVVDTIIKSMRA